MNDEQVEDFLEHHGVKGMRWGVRNKKKASTVRKNRPLSYLKKHKVGIAQVSVVAALTAGTAAASVILARRGMIKIEDANSFNEASKVSKIEKARRSIEIAKLIRNFDKVKVDDISSTRQRSEKQIRRESKQIRKELAKSIIRKN